MFTKSKRANKKETRGLFQLKINSTIYTNRGVGGQYRRVLYVLIQRKRKNNQVQVSPRVLYFSLLVSWGLIYNTKHVVMASVVYYDSLLIIFLLYGRRLELI